MPHTQLSGAGELSVFNGGFGLHPSTGKPAPGSAPSMADAFNGTEPDGPSGKEKKPDAALLPGGKVGSRGGLGRSMKTMVSIWGRSRPSLVLSLSKLGGLNHPASRDEKGGPWITRS